MAGRKGVAKTFRQEFEAAAEKVGEQTVKEHLERLQTIAGSANKSAWEFAELAYQSKEAFGFSLSNLAEFVKPYSTARLSEFVRTYSTFKDSDLVKVASFDLANVARKAHQGFDWDTKNRFTPEATLRSFLDRNLTARKARQELATVMRNGNLATCMQQAVNIAAMHPELLDRCHQSDCRELFQTIPNSSVKLIFADPPYLGYKRLGIKTYTNGHEDVSGLEADADSLDPAEALRLYCDLISGAPRVLSTNGVLALFLSATMHTDLKALRAIYDAIDEAGLRIAHELFWVKNKIPPKSFHRPFSTQTETIWLLCRDGDDIADCFDTQRGVPLYLPNQPTLRTNLIYCTTETGRYLAARRSGSARNLVVHQFEKPVELGMYLIEKLTLPGELVWDACGCHANLTVAAIRLDRRFVYSESHADRFAEGLRRIHRAERSTLVQLGSPEDNPHPQSKRAEDAALQVAA